MMETINSKSLTVRGTTDTLNTIWSELLGIYKSHEAHDDGVMDVIKTLVNDDRFNRINNSATEFVYVKSATDIVTIVVIK